MAIRIETAGLDDAEEIGEMIPTASTSPRVTLEFRNCNREDIVAWIIARVKIEIKAAVERPDLVVALKAVDEETGSIAGYAIWAWDGTISDTVFPALANLPRPAGTNTDLRVTFLERLTALEEELKPKVSPLFELLQVVTSARYQRRGIGSQLVSYGLKRADEQNVPVFLTGTPMGVPVYRKLGFEDVGKLELDLEPYGGEGTHVHVAMIRKPRA